MVKVLLKVSKNDLQLEIRKLKEEMESYLSPSNYRPPPGWVSQADWWKNALSSGRICTVIYALFGCRLLLPDLSWIDTGLWFTGTPPPPPSPTSPHPSQATPGYILASVKHSRTFPVLSDHFYITFATINIIIIMADYLQHVQYCPH